MNRYFQNRINDIERRIKEERRCLCELEDDISDFMDELDDITDELQDFAIECGHTIDGWTRFDALIKRYNSLVDIQEWINDAIAAVEKAEDTRIL